MNYKNTLLIVFLLVGSLCFSQEEVETIQKSNIQEYTPSKLLNKGQWDV